jgi:N-acetylglucosaminyl-diphospho-decaprenol L-rhamnosyltransferase
VNAPPVAVAVVSWNTRELLRRCLDSLEPEIDRGRAEVWVVDNASGDGSAELVEADFGSVSLIRSPSNVGFGPAVNLVAGRTGSPWIAPANADVELERGALDAMLAAGGAHPECGIVAPRLIAADGSTQHSVHSFPTTTLSLVLYSGLARVVPGLGDRLCLEGHWNADRARRVDWAHGAFLLVRREAFEQAGGFDDRQWMYAEDLDLAWRLARAGRPTFYEPRATVRHAGAAATSQAFGEARRSTYMTASHAWMVRRRGLVLTWTFAAVNVLGSTARWLLSAARGRLTGSRSRADEWRAYARVHRLGLRRRSTLLDGR